MLAEDISCSKEAKDIIVDCCVGLFKSFSVRFDTDRHRAWAEWVKLLSSQANAVSDESSKKTISPEHVVEALRVNRPPPQSLRDV